MSFRWDLTFSLAAAAFGAVVLGGCARGQENVAEVVAQGGCPQRLLDVSSCSGASVATTDDELAAVLDLWGYDLADIRASVPDLWDYHNDVVEMPDDGRVVVVLGVNGASDCEPVVYDWSVDQGDGGAVVDVSTALNGRCRNTDLKLGSMLLVLKAEPPVVRVEADGRALTLVAPEASGE